MNFRSFVMFAMCFVYGAAAIGAQNGSPTANANDARLPLKKCWAYSVENIGRSAVSAVNGTVYLAESEGRVRALDILNGEIIWVTELGGVATALRAVPKVGIAVVTENRTGGVKSLLRLLSAESGLVKYSVGIDTVGEIHLLSGEGRLIAADAQGTIVSTDTGTGEIQWRLKLPAKLTAQPVVSGEKLVVATEDRKLTAVSPRDGRIIASILVDRPITAIAIRENEMIVAGDDRGRITNYRDMTGGVWWQFKSGARVGSIIETSEGMLVGSYDNFLYLLSKYSGDVRWKRRLDGRIVSAPTLINAGVLTAASTVPNAQLIDLENGKVIDQIFFGENRYMLAEPLVSGGSVAVFTLVDGVVAYSESTCLPNEKGGAAAARKS